MSVPATKHIALDDWALEIDVAESAQQSSEIELQTDVEVAAGAGGPCTIAALLTRPSRESMAL